MKTHLPNLRKVLRPVDIEPVMELKKFLHRNRFFTEMHGSATEGTKSYNDIDITATGYGGEFYFWDIKHKIDHLKRLGDINYDVSDAPYSSSLVPKIPFVEGRNLWLLRYSVNPTDKHGDTTTPIDLFLATVGDEKPRPNSNYVSRVIQGGYR